MSFAELSSSSTPAELDVPTPFLEANLAIKILSCEYVGHDVVEALGRYFSEYARSSTWAARAKWSGPMPNIAALEHIQLAQVRRAYEAWKAFEDLDRLDAPADLLGERRLAARKALAAALIESADALARTREAGGRQSP